MSGHSDETLRQVQSIAAAAQEIAAGIEELAASSEGMNSEVKRAIGDAETLMTLAGEVKSAVTT